MSMFTDFMSNLTNYMQLASLMDMLDILIVAYLIYKLLTLIRKTTAAQVLKGIVLLLVMLGISAMLNLNVLNFILASAVQVGFLALVIVFQPELRKVLEQFGSSRITKLLGREDLDRLGLEHVIEQTADAAGTLAAQKIGALVVFERKVFLNDALQTGTIIDSEVSSMLLKNLFFPNASLHDGAVIIREGRIVGAGCMLPLTANANLSRDLGMRHRAGVGISEVTDAVALVVSEETGSISVAIGGLLRRHLTKDTLIALLRKELSLNEDEAVKPGIAGLYRRISKRLDRGKKKK